LKKDHDQPGNEPDLDRSGNIEIVCKAHIEKDIAMSRKVFLENYLMEHGGRG